MVMECLLNLLRRVHHKGPMLHKQHNCQTLAQQKGQGGCFSLIIAVEHTPVHKTQAYTAEVTPLKEAHSLQE